MQLRTAGLVAVQATLLIGAAACVDGSRPVAPGSPIVRSVDEGGGVTPARRAIGSDAVQAAIAQVDESFGGMYYGDDGRLNVYAVDAGREASIKRALGASAGVAGTLEQHQQSIDAVTVLPARHGFLDLLRWRRKLDGLLQSRDLVYSDVDERMNRVAVGVADESAARRVRVAAKRLGVPEEAVAIEVTAPIVLLQGVTLRDRFRPVTSGLEITWRIDAMTRGVCTLGFNVHLPNDENPYFLTNAHCKLSPRGVVGDTPFYQGTPLTAPQLIGNELSDPPFFTGGVCPVGRRCRFSDAALGFYYEGVDVNFGTILMTMGGPAPGTLTINPFVPGGGFLYRGLAVAVVGEQLHKVGRTTGWTSGTVAQTCINTNVSGTDITMLCQDRVALAPAEIGPIVAGGDSGSPVFAWWPGAYDMAIAYGLLWGSAADGRSFVFSTWAHIVEELGEMTPE